MTWKKVSGAEQAEMERLATLSGYIHKDGKFKDKPNYKKIGDVVGRHPNVVRYRLNDRFREDCKKDHAARSRAKYGLKGGRPRRRNLTGDEVKKLVGYSRMDEFKHGDYCGCYGHPQSCKIKGLLGKPNISKLAKKMSEVLPDYDDPMTIAAVAYHLKNYYSASEAAA